MYRDREGGKPGKATIEPLLPGVLVVHRSFADFGVRGCVLVPDAGPVVVWDTLVEPADMAAVAALTTGNSVTVVYSHADWDHCWGTAGLPDRSAVIAHEACIERFATELPAEMAAKKATEPGRWAMVELVPPTVTFASTFAVPLGSAQLELRWVGGHSGDSVAGVVKDWGLLLAGDLAEDPFPEVRDPERIDDWIRAMEKWAADPDLHTVVPGHGAIGGTPLLRKNVEYLRSVERGDQNAPKGANAYYRRVHEKNLAAVGRR